MKISICIPTWENHGRGKEFLEFNFIQILKQNYPNFDVIISDHSIDNQIQELCESYSDKLEILYIRNQNMRGNSPSNTNNCILNANGEIIKILFQDDFFYDKTALYKIHQKFLEENCDWVVTGCNHTYDDGKSYSNNMSPSWNEKIPLGINTISSPSVLSFKKGVECFFDENLTMLMDCEMYYQLYLKFGEPKIITDQLITNRIHSKQISSLYQKNIHEEINYVKFKHNI